MCLTLLMLCSIVGSAAEENLPTSNIKGLGPVSLLVELDLDEATKALFVKSSIQIRNELVKSINGKFLVEPNQSKHPQIFVYIKLRGFQIAATGERLIGYRIETAVREHALLDRLSRINTISPTSHTVVESWRRNDAGFSNQQSLDKLLSSILQNHMDELQLQSDEPVLSNQSSIIEDDLLKLALEKLLLNLAVGNSSKVTITKLERNGTQIEFEAQITHRQTSTLIEKKIIGKYRYVMDTTTKGTFDLANPDSLKNTKVCTKLPPLLGSKEICVSLADLAGTY